MGIKLIKKDIEKGFTLIEMMVVIGIIGILAGMAIPAFSSWLPKYRFKSAAQDLFSNLQLAKITAVKRNANCTVTFSVPSLNRYIPVGDGINYDYVVFVEPGIVDYEYTAGVDEIIVKKRWVDYDENIGFNTSQGGGMGVSFPFNASASPMPTISFRPNGFPVDKDNLPKGGSVFVKNNKNRTMKINVNAAGSITID